MKPRPPGTAAKDAEAEFPPFAPAAFAAGLRTATGEEPSPELVSRLLAHYEELRRWAPRVDLVGPAFGSELFERHYGEALAALELLPPGPGRLLDVGSGAGFPGFVLAAARPDLETVLLEPRERRGAFLEAAARRAGVSLRVVGGRVSADPAEFDPTLEGFTIVTVRALQLKPSAWQALTSRLAPGARLLEWTGEAPLDLPPSFRPGRKLRLSGERRFLRESLLASPPGIA